jgi:hypothetical protein
MYKKYVVRLSDEERQVCQDVVKKLKGSSQKVRRAQVLLKADADGPEWTDARIAEAFHCRVQTIENLRKRLVTEGFEAALNGKVRESPPTPRLLDGQGEAKLIALRLAQPSHPMLKHPLFSRVARHFQSLCSDERTQFQILIGCMISADTPSR